MLVQVIMTMLVKLAKDGSAMDGNIRCCWSGNNAESGTFRFRNATDTHAEIF